MCMLILVKYYYEGCGGFFSRFWGIHVFGVVRGNSSKGNGEVFQDFGRIYTPE